MKINEILNSLTEETIDVYTNRLLKTLNIKRLGRGLFADVFQHPEYENVAVKIFLVDKSYQRYLRWCLDHQHNHFVPKIINLIQQKDNDVKGGKYNIVFFQKLEPAGSKLIQAFVKSIISTSWFKEEFGRGKRYNTFNDFLYDEWNTIANHADDNDLKEIAKFFAQTRNNFMRLDLHSKNIMRRGDQLVFVDPVS